MTGLVNYLVLLTLMNFGDSLADWSYNEVNKWKNEYPDCGGGKQSPINIVTSSALADSSLVPFQFAPAFTEPIAQAALTNTGNSYQIDDPQGTRTVSGGGLPVTSQFTLKQFHLHLGSKDSRVGSEHQIDNKQYPGEMHFVFIDAAETSEDSDPTIAVLALFIDISEDAKNEKFWNSITDAVASAKNPGDKVDLPSSINLSDVLRMSQKHSSVSAFYRYNGSLTTPPCSEGVTWTLFQEPILISTAQYDQFFPVGHSDSGEQSQRPSNNFRPLMDLNSRTVYKSQTGADEISSKGSLQLCSVISYALVLKTVYGIVIKTY
ncbi:carbonic anhydrase 7-like [Convolutriloba macropyga]|uniref:carbonic anhydrase 7-like n=1 Tax=Convolutriloba macropyga TaxID=536237 RepID=UPI003F51EBF6